MHHAVIVCLHIFSWIVHMSASIFAMQSWKSVLDGQRYPPDAKQFWSGEQEFSPQGDICKSHQRAEQSPQMCPSTMDFAALGWIKHMAPCINSLGCLTLHSLIVCFANVSWFIGINWELYEEFRQIDSASECNESFSSSLCDGGITSKNLWND